MASEERADLLKTAVEAVRGAGRVVLDNLGVLSGKDIFEKRAFDFVTTVDRAAEQAVIETIRGRYPEHAFLTEESLKESAGGYRWIVDPLDGTTNYIHGYPVFGVSVALEQEGAVLVGAVLDPLRDELFTAVKGEGAYLNGKPIRVSGVLEMKKGLIATGFPFRDKDKIDDYLRVFRDLFTRVSDIRRAGSAVLDLAYLACGRNDGFFEIRLFPWDLAAGGLLIKEAGGVVTDFSGGPDYLETGNIVAGNPFIHKEILSTVRSVFEGTIDK